MENSSQTAERRLYKKRLQLFIETNIKSIAANLPLPEETHLEEIKSDIHQIEKSIQSKYNKALVL